MNQINDVDILWVTICAGLVFLMQGGFLCLESGLTRSKNSINVAAKNLIDIGTSVIIFWAIGSLIMFGNGSGSWVAAHEMLKYIKGIESHDNTSLICGWYFSVFLFQAMFCGTAVTIVSGAVAERMSFLGYWIIAVLVSSTIY